MLPKVVSLPHKKCYRGRRHDKRQHRGVYRGSALALPYSEKEGEGKYLGRVHPGDRLSPQGSDPFAPPTQLTAEEATGAAAALRRGSGECVVQDMGGQRPVMFQAA